MQVPVGCRTFATTILAGHFPARINTRLEQSISGRFTWISNLKTTFHSRLRSDRLTSLCWSVGGGKRVRRIGVPIRFARIFDLVASDRILHYLALLQVRQHGIRDNSRYGVSRKPD